MYLSLFLAIRGAADVLYLGSRDVNKVATVMHNTRVVSLMQGAAPKIEPLECNLLKPDKMAEIFKTIKPTLIVHSAALLSLYPFFPSLRKRQERMNCIAGFAHTLPKDLALLWPLMQAVKEACPQTPVISLAAPDTANFILKGLNLSPTIGAGTIDSTAHGVRIALARHLEVSPRQITVNLVCHHSIRRFPPGTVPFSARFYCDGKDITDQCNAIELISEAVDVSGVETMTTPVSSNAPITAASAAETARIMLMQPGQIRHGSGALGMPGGCPVKLTMTHVEAMLPEGMTEEEAFQINHAGMKITGVQHVDPDGTVRFTEKEKSWIREGLGLSWDKMRLVDCAAMSKELEVAYRRLHKEESS
jgi:hypothetical protein